MTQALFKMSRPNNLLMIIFAMFAFRFGFAHTIAPEDFTQWMQFIAMRPNVIMIDMKGETHLIRQKETLQYLEMPEEMPLHLKEFKL